MNAGNPYLLRCHVCGEALIVFTRGGRSPEIGCLNCLASNDARDVSEDSVNLIGGTLTVQQAQDLRQQFRTSGRTSG
jgi:hypothetical protein